MTHPFKGDFPILRKHSEDEYLTLENNFKALVNAVGSLFVITETGEESIEIKYSALTQRLNQIYDHYESIKGDLSFDGRSDQRDSAAIHTDPPYKFAIRINADEKKMIEDSLYNLASMLGKDDSEFHKYNKLAKEIEEAKNVTETKG